MSTRNDVDIYLNLLSQLNDDVTLFKEKWKMFYFCSISPFKICNVSKEDFFFFADRFSKSKISTRENVLKIDIGNDNEAILHLHTEIDFELYEKYVLKKNLENVS